MHFLPFVIATLAALVVTPSMMSVLGGSGLARTNYRDRRLPFPLGVVVIVAAALALVVLAALQRLAGLDVFEPQLAGVAIYVLGVAFLGLLDDVVDAAPRGWRGHGSAVLSGGLSTGALKAAGSLGFALLALLPYPGSDGRYLLAVVLLVLTTNLFNLLDLRPGRTAKVFVLLGAGLTIGSLDVAPLWTLGLFAGPVLVLGLYDVRERAMLGDVGSNAIGALAGLWMVLTLGAIGQAIAVAVVLAITIYGEFRSISAFVERAPLVRDLDSLGRPR